MSAIDALRAEAALAGSDARGGVFCRSCGIELWLWNWKVSERPPGSVKSIAGRCAHCKKFGGRERVPHRSNFPSVARLRRMGRSNGEIANLLGVSRRTIERWVVQMRSEGLL